MVEWSFRLLHFGCCFFCYFATTGAYIIVIVINNLLKQTSSSSSSLADSHRIILSTSKGFSPLLHASLWAYLDIIVLKRPLKQFIIVFIGRSFWPELTPPAKQLWNSHLFNGRAVGCTLLNERPSNQCYFSTIPVGLSRFSEEQPSPAIKLTSIMCFPKIEKPPWPYVRTCCIDAGSAVLTVAVLTMTGCVRPHLYTIWKTFCNFRRIIRCPCTDFCFDSICGSVAVCSS